MLLIKYLSIYIDYKLFSNQLTLVLKYTFESKQNSKIKLLPALTETVFDILFHSIRLHR